MIAGLCEINSTEVVSKMNTRFFLRNTPAKVD